MGKKKVSDEEIEMVRQICEGYLSAMKRLDENRKRLLELTEEMNRGIPDFVRWLYEQEIDNLKSQIHVDTENTGYCQWALEHLDKRDRSVMEQLYVEGYTWNSVIDEKGRIMQPGIIGKVRHRSFVKMAELISWMKKEVMARPTKSEIERQDPADQTVQTGDPSIKNP